jgi:hypothetical protein
LASWEDKRTVPLFYFDLYDVRGTFEMANPKKSYFISPPDVTLPGYSYYQGCATYTKYNYTQKGIASRLRRRHFVHALQLAERVLSITRIYRPPVTTDIGPPGSG